MAKFSWKKYLGWLVEVRPETAAWAKREEREENWRPIDFVLGEDVTYRYLSKRFRLGGRSGWEPGTLRGKEVGLGGKDAFLHTMVVGPTGSGKTSRLLKPMVFQILEDYQKGNRVGVTIIEPKGDFAWDVVKACRDAGIPVIHIDPFSPDTARFNPLVGESETVAEMMRTVLMKMFGKQEAFFSQVQQTAARNTILLLKAVRGNEVTLLDVVRVLRDDSLLEQEVTAYERKYGKDDFSEYFRAEMIGKEDFRKFAVGLRLQLEDIIGNSMIRRVLVEGNDIDLDEFLARGGVLAVNTGIGLGRLSDVFGQLILMSLQNAIFRRPGDEWTRRPHYLFVDEFPRYLNPDIERLLNIGRSYRCACVLALQSLSQLDDAENNKEEIIGGCRNKIVFGGIQSADAKRFAAEFGKEEGERTSRSYAPSLFNFLNTAERITESEAHVERMTETEIIELPAFHFAYRLVRNDQLQVPGIAIGRLAKPLKVTTNTRPRTDRQERTGPEQLHENKPLMEEPQVDLSPAYCKDRQTEKDKAEQLAWQFTGWGKETEEKGSLGNEIVDDRAGVKTVTKLVPPETWFRLEKKRRTVKQ